MSALFSLVAASCVSQTFSYGNFEHMALINRVWQFALGFIAYELRQIGEKSSVYSRLGDVDPLLPSTDAKSEKTDAQVETSTHPAIIENRRFAYAAEQLAYYALPALIAAGVCIPLYSASFGSLLGRHIQLDRLFLLALVVGLLARRGPHAALSSTTACFLGDASYSIYLVHWPIYVVSKYLAFVYSFSYFRKL